ncbi:MAG: serine protease [Rhodoplanes sp.]
MRFRGAALVLFVGSLAMSVEASAQPVAPGPARPQGTGRSARPPARPAPGSPTAVYAAMPEAERIAIQFDLIWTGDYNGMANGDFGESSIAAVKTFQKNHAGKETGILNTDERLRLAQAAKASQQRVGWQVIEDRTTGVQLGVPTKIVPQQRPASAGARWQTGRGEIQVETFRMADPAVTLARAFEQQKKEPPQRKVEYSVLRGDFFVLSGLQGLKKFYVRAHEKDHEVRGVTVLYDQATEGIMDPVAVAMSNAFDPFPTSLAGGGAPKRKVEYASGAVVSAGGDIVTDARAVTDCQFIVVPGRGRADKLADQDGLALLHIYGARDLAPLTLASDAAQRGEIVLAGVPDPQAQAGRSAVSTARAELTPGADGVSVAPAPVSGFAGAAALDPDGRLVGLVAPRPQMVAGPTSAGVGAAALLPVAAIKALLAKQGVAAASARPSLEAAKAGVVRVICVRE